MNTRLQRALLIGALALAVLFPGAAAANPIIKAVTIQVYDVCDSSGYNCAPTGPTGDAYFAAETDKIWSQAGIYVGFNFAGLIDSTSLLNINDSVTGEKFTDLESHGSSTTVDMFLVDTVAGAYGEGWMGAGGLVIAMDTVMAFNSGAGRIDTIAHELGHNLGLVPLSLGGDSGGHSGPAYPNYLMASGDWRTVPSSLADIAPSGAALDLIPQDQIDYALGSSLLHDDVPEPASMALAGLGLLALVTIRRRRGV